MDMAWTMLMLDDFKELRYFMYKTTAELQRFRQLVVNAVLATDIMDKELKVLRNNRWEKAFSGDVLEESYSDKTNRKATIVVRLCFCVFAMKKTMFTAFWVSNIRFLTYYAIVD